MFAEALLSLHNKSCYITYVIPLYPIQIMLLKQDSIFLCVHVCLKKERVVTHAKRKVAADKTATAEKQHSPYPLNLALLEYWE